MIELICQFPSKELNPKEYAKVVHEINTYYSKYKDEKLGVHYSYAPDCKCYCYFFVNNGFNNYVIYAKKLIES